MLQFCEKTKGVISIFLTLIILPVFIFSGLIVDGSRISAARTRVSGAGDLALNSALSEYDHFLYDLYGIFAVSDNMSELQTNVTRYFRNTIENTGALNDSDSYTRQFINSIFSSFSSSDMQFDNIVDTKYEDFELTGVESSSIANPTVMENQIIEYMKYRAPINLTKGLLTKLGCLGETSKQTKAVENKVEYDKKLNTVQDACNAAYKAINDFKDDISNGKYNDVSYKESIRSDMENAKNDFLNMTDYIVAAKSDLLSVGSLQEDNDEKTKILKEINEYTESDQNSFALKTIESELNPYIQIDVFSKTYKSDYLGFSETSQDAFETQIKDSYYLNKNLKTLDIIYADLNLFNDYYQKLEADTSNYDSLPQEDKDAYAFISSCYRTIKNQIQSGVSAAQAYVSSWKDKANGYGQQGSTLISGWMTPIDNYINELDGASKALETVLKKVKDLDSVRTNWSNSISNLSDSDVKTSMQGDFEASAKDINEDAVNKLKAIIDNNKKYFESLKERLGKIKYFEQQVGSEDSAINSYDKFSAFIEGNHSTSYQDVRAISNKDINEKYHSENLDGMDPSDFTKINADDEQQQFYKYLSKICTESKAKEDSDAKKTAKSQRSELTGKGNDSSNTTVDAVSGNLTGTIDSSIPADVQQALDDFYSDTGSASGDTYTNNHVDDTDDNNKAADQQKKNLAGISTLLEDLGKVAESGRDKLYLEEYMTEMFSCYSDKTLEEGEQKKIAYSLNNNKLDEDFYFGGETEYILWGDSNLQTDLNKTKALMFGVRFALNTIFAFTNSYTREPAFAAATAIAGWTGFGVPVVQTIILLAWSMAESAVDINNLSQGKSVAVYKSSTTWILGIDGAVRELTEKSKEIAGAVTDDVFNEIEDVADDKLGDIKNAVTTYSQTLAGGILSSIKSAISVPIQQLTLQIAGGANELSETEIGEKYVKLLNGLSDSSEGGDLSSQAKKMALNYLLESQNKNDVVKELIDIYSTANDKDTTVSKITEEEGKLIKDINSKVEKNVSQFLNDNFDKLNKEVEQTIAKGGATVKENVENQIEEFSSEISGEQGTKSQKVTSASGFSMTYKEYLKAFILIHMLRDSDKNLMLKRTTELMQVNLKKNNASFEVSKAFTLLKATGTVDVKTTFFNVPVTSGCDAEGKVNYILDYSRIGSSWQKIQYIGVLGFS